MSPFQESSPGAYSVLIFLLGIFLLVSPFAAWWMGIRAPWYVPFLLWLVLIALSAALARSQVRRHDA